MQDACQTKFVIDLAHRGVSEGLGLDSSRRLRIVSLSHARNKMKKRLSHIGFVLTCQNFRLSPSLKCDPKPAMTSRCPNYLVKFNVENGR